MSHSNAHHSARPILGLLFCMMILVAPLQASQVDEEDNHQQAAGGEHGEQTAAHEESVRKLGLDSWRSWFFLSILEEDEAETLGLEFESYFHLGSYEVKNISYFELNDYPRPIPGFPPGNEVPEFPPGEVIDTGIGDLLSGFWFSKRGKPHTKHHFALGFAASLPTADNEGLGSGKWSLGPSFDYEYESEKVFGGAIVLHLWSVGGDAARKDVNFTMIKPFFYYHLGTKWDLIYVPYGISIYWNKPSGEDVYLPLGGGFQRTISKHVNMSLQAHEYVLRSSKGAKYDARFMLEIVF